MDTSYIKTDRLILRSWRESDRIPFAKMNGNRNVMKYFPKTLTEDESNAFIDRIVAEFEETGFGLYAVEIKETGEFIGYVGFHRFNFDVSFSPGWEIGWRISERFWHKDMLLKLQGPVCAMHARITSLINFTLSQQSTIYPQRM